MLMLVTARVFRAGDLFVRLRESEEGRLLLSAIRYPLSTSLR